jgi:hypothetical protein
MCRPCGAHPGGDASKAGSARGWGSVGIKLADFGNAFGELDHDEEVRDLSISLVHFERSLEK